MNKLRVLALMHRHLVPPDTIPEGTDLVSAPWRTEYDVMTTLKAMGHEVQPLAVHDDLGDIRRASTEWKPHIAFNLLEGFDDITIFDQNVVSHLELLKLPYTGCNPRGLLMSRDKSLSKKLLAYHRIRVPEFDVYRIGRPVRRPKRLAFPLIVKSLTQEASIGISQASVVESDEKLKERVTFIHESIGTAAIAEQYIEGRELYVGVIGNQALQALPVWELFFTNMPAEARRIATDRVKWSVKYQKKYGIDSGPAKDIPEAVCDKLQHTCKRAFRALELSGYARIDLRLDRGGQRLGARGQSQPADCQGGRLRRLRREDGHRLRGAAPADHEPGTPLAAGEFRVSRLGRLLGPVYCGGSHRAGPSPIFTTNVVNVRLAVPTRPVTSQQPGVGKIK